MLRSAFGIALLFGYMSRVPGVITLAAWLELEGSLALPSLFPRSGMVDSVVILGTRLSNESTDGGQTMTSSQWQSDLL